MTRYRLVRSGLLAACLGIVGLYLPQTVSDMATRLEQHASLRAVADQANSAEAGEATIQSSLIMLERGLARIDSVLYSSDEFGSALDYLFEAARSSDVELIETRPAALAMSGGYGIGRVDLTISGRFHNVMAFVNRVERAERTMRFHSLSLKSQPRGNLKAAAHVVVALRREGGPSKS